MRKLFQLRSSLRDVGRSSGASEAWGGPAVFWLGFLTVLAQIGCEGGRTSHPGGKGGRAGAQDAESEGATVISTDGGSSTSTATDCVRGGEVRFDERCVADGRYVFLRDIFRLDRRAVEAVNSASAANVLSLAIPDLLSGDRVFLMGQLGLRSATAAAVSVRAGLKGRDDLTALETWVQALPSSMAERPILVSGFDAVTNPGGRQYDFFVGTPGVPLTISASGSHLTGLVFHEYSLAELAARPETPAYFLFATATGVQGEAATVQAGVALPDAALPPHVLASESVGVAEGDLVLVTGAVTLTPAEGGSPCEGGLATIALSAGDAVTVARQEVVFRAGVTPVEVPVLGVFHGAADATVDFRVRLHLRSDNCAVEVAAYRSGFTALVFRPITHLARFIASARSLATMGVARTDTSNLPVTAATSASPVDVLTATLEINHQDVVVGLNQTRASLGGGSGENRFYGVIKRTLGEVANNGPLQGSGLVGPSQDSDNTWLADTFAATDPAVFGGENTTRNLQLTLSMIGTGGASMAVSSRLYWFVFRPIAP